jgi:hypothetical protein
MGNARYAGRFLSSFAIAIAVFVAVAIAVSLGVRLPTFGREGDPWWRNPTVWLLVFAAMLVVRIVQRWRARRRSSMGG